MKPQDVTHFHLFGGSGSGAAGFKDADPTIGAIKGIVSVLKGKREPLPVIGDLVQSVKESIAKRKNKR